MWWTLLVACPSVAPVDDETESPAPTSTDAEHSSHSEVDTGCEGGPCRLRGTVDLMEADARIEGSSGEAELGLGVAAAGDIDGDGAVDFLVGARRRAGVGEAYVFVDALRGDATADDAYAVVRGSETGMLGWGLTGAGDVNGDGHVDLLLGDTQLAGVGQASLLLGPIVGEHDISEAVWSASGTDINGRMGWEVVDLGDLDADGFDDFVVGGYLDEDERGHVVLVHGAAEVGDFREQTLLGLSERDHAGRALTGGDLNGDGLAEVVVGARFVDTDGADGGTVYVLAGPATAVGSLEDASATLLGSAFEHAGWTVDGTGDLDGDGYADLVVGGQYERGTTGRVWVVPGPPSGEALLDEVATAQLFGQEPFDDFARELDVGDVDADGLPDLLIGAREDADVAPNAGAAWLIHGPFTGSRTVGEPSDWVGLGAGDQELAGESVALVGDLDGDGFGELLIGAAGAPGESGPDAGRAYLFYGSGR